MIMRVYGSVKLKGPMTMKMWNWLIYFVSAVSNIYIRVKAEGLECVGLTCENGGTVAFNSSIANCHCLCPPDITGLLCEYHIQESVFPSGPYALPMSKDGCPEGPARGWVKGNINITTRHSFYKTDSFPVECQTFVNDIQHVLKINNPAFTTSILGPFDRYTLQLNFCFKRSGYRSVNGASWPNGTFGVYGFNKCPLGFSAHELSICIPHLLHYQIDGYVPTVNISEGLDGSELKLLYCRHEDTVQEINNLESLNPYMVIKDPESAKFGCPEMAGFETIDEHFPIPVPTRMGGLNTTYPGKQYEHFQFSYCHFIPIDFKWSDDYNADDYSALFQKGGFPGDVYPLVTVTNETYGCGKIGVQISDCGSTQVWIMIDIRRAILVSVLMIFDESDRKLTVALSHIYVSDKKWGFLNDGALLCRHNGQTSTAIKHTIRCYRPQHGRFVTLISRPGLGEDLIQFRSMFSVYTNSTKQSSSMFSVFMYNTTEVYAMEKKYKGEPYLHRVSAEIAAVISYADTEMKSCKQELGMQDYGIRDGQITASSWLKENPASQARPQNSGWCADNTDKMAFIQVDLVFVTWIDGIVLFNWNELIDVHNENIFGRVMVARGSASLHVQYGFDTQSVHYTKELFYDVSKEFGEPQTFIFSDPFLARYLRMYPRAFPGTNITCLNFEVLGCRNSDLIKLKCGKQSQKQISHATSILVPFHKIPFSFPNASSSDCEAHCLDIFQDCLSTILQENGSCLVYTVDENYNYMTYPQWKGDVLSMGYCLLDPEERPDSFKFQSSLKIYKDIVTESGILTSIGYPLTYAYNSVYRWKLYFPKKFVILQFMDISLREFSNYKQTYGYLDAIILPRKLDNVWNAFEDFIQTKQLSSFILTNADNGRTPRFATSTVEFDKSKHLTFYSCSYGSVLEAGRGFRVHISGTEKLYCPNSDSFAVCQFSSMELIYSRFLINSNFEKSEYTWLIKGCSFSTEDGILGEHSLTRTFEFKDFDLSCHSESSLTIGEHTYCNHNRPYGEQVILSSNTTVTFKSNNLQSAVDTVFPEIFRLTYRCMPKEEVLPDAANLNQDKRQEKVCVTELGKCYIIQTVTPSSNSWDDVANICVESNALLVNIKTDTEMLHVRGILMEYYLKRQYYVTSDVFIGLRRYIDSSRMQHEHWTDGSPASFTAWDNGEPSDAYFKLCTKMSLTKPYNDTNNDNNTWRTVQCSKQYSTESFIALCEYKTNSSGSVQTGPTLEINLTKDPFDELKDMSSLSQCASGEWILKRAKCNGVAECLDASDEIMCELPDKINCGEEEFKCSDGDCIHVSQVCDFVEDCRDASDEYCDFPSCSFSEFTCANGQCIPEESRCDSVSNCLDASDERNCDTCNKTSAFQCGDNKCISKRLVCDKHIDCADGADEVSCDHEYRRCDQLWRDGYTTNGIFRTGKGHYIHCNFDDLRKGWGTIEMTLLNTDWKQLWSDFRFRIETAGATDAVQSGFRCTQRFAMVPHREKATILYLDNRTIYTSAIDVSLNTLFRYGEDVRPNRQEFAVEVNGNDGNLFVSFTVSLFETFESFKNRLSISGAKCNKYIPETEGIEEQVLFCRRGVRPTRRLQRCLYSKDENGITGGCRSLEHLKNCESFTCPQNYIKCPGSYCLPLKYVCNGKIDCPDGFDENVCACKKKSMKIIIMVPALGFSLNDRSKNLIEIATQLGGAMFTEGSTIKVFRVFNDMCFTDMIGFWKRSVCNGYRIVITDIVMNSEHVSQTSRTFLLSNDDLERLILNNLIPEKKENRSALILLTDGQSGDWEGERISLLQRAYENNITSYRVVLDKAINTHFNVTNGPFVKEIHVKDTNVLRTIGPELFPEICKGKILPCNGGYRCLLSKVCIPLQQVCDMQRQCPYGDDEHHCDFICPQNCTCGPLIVNCSNLQKEDGHLDLNASPRVLTVANSSNICNNILTNDITRRTFSLLISLNMSWCEIESLIMSSFQWLQNLIELDLSYNHLSTLVSNVFSGLKSLKVLDLRGNYKLQSIEPGAFRGIKIKSLSIKYTQLQTLAADTFKGLNLEELDLSNNNISSIQDYSFNSLSSVSIDISGNPIKEFTKIVFNGVKGVKRLRTPAYKFCCIRPSYLNVENCLPQRDEFSSCEDLLRNSTLQALMWTIGILAVIGNVTSLVYRLLYDGKRLKLGYGIFVTNLAVADLLMGVYMIIIAVADKIFRDRYIEMDEYWRNSSWCQLAGVLSTVSSEGSVLFMCLITFDRILVIKYPFGQLRFKTKSALTACLICWVLVLLIALLPVLYTDYFQGKFYSKSAVCLALPLTRNRTAGWLYSILIFIGFNFCTFILIAVGQLLIYVEVKKQSSIKKSLSMTRTNDLKVARNLLLVVTTDFLCWFPIGVMGVLALTGYTIPGEVYAWTAVIILPINSALNPFMYTLTAIYNRQSFNPSLEEQSRTDLTKEMGKIMLKIYPYIPTNRKMKNTTIFTLTDLMNNRNLSVHETIMLIFRVFSFVDILHGHELVLQGITGQEVMLVTSACGQRIRRVKIDLERYPELSSRRSRKTDDIYNLGCLLDQIVLHKKRPGCAAKIEENAFAKTSNE